MPKLLGESAVDAGLGYISAHAALLTLCAGPTTSADAAKTPVSAGGVMLASQILSPATAATFTVADGTGGGRRLLVGGLSEVAGLEAGLADHVALIDTAANELLLLTELTDPQPVEAGTVISVRSFSAEIGAPV
ncbi:MAG: hypothetical protein AAFN27_03375 [Pseudomonadota bacterium]